MLNRATFLACVAAAAAVPAPDAEPIQVPHLRRGLAPRADGSADFEGFLRELNSTLKKYKADHTLLPMHHYMGGSLLGGILEDRAVKNLPLVDQDADLLYYGNGQVGATSPQTFTIDFDTGSSDFFVPGPNCGSGCKGSPYDEGGVAEGNTTSVTYGSGQISGKNFFDTVCVAGLCAPHTNVISLTSAQGFSTSASNSLMGMGFSTIASSKQPTFFENLMKAGKVTKPEFSFYLGRKADGTGPKSQLTLGGVDASKFSGKQKAHKVTKKGYWQLAIDGAAVSGHKALLTTGQAAIDTGTTVIIAPTVAATGLFLNVLGAAPIPLVATGSATETAFAFPCDTKSTISLIFSGVSYAINPKDLSLGQLTPALAKNLGVPGLAGECIAAIIAADINPGSELYVVGDTFLKNWHSTYSYAKGATVSFAKSV